MSWRKLHFWLSLVGLVQMALWILSGVGFALLPDDEVQGLVSSRGLKPVPISGETVTVSALQVADILEERVGRNPVIQKITLTNRVSNDRPMYVVKLKDEPDPRLIDACTGDELSSVTELDATNIARRDFSGSGDVTGVEWVTEKYQKGFDYNGPFPAYRVNFSDRKHTRIYISPYTGQILARRNLYKTMRDLFWTVHVFGYLEREVPTNMPLLIASVISLAAAMSGILIYIPHIRRRRFQPQPRSSAWRKIHFWLGLVVFTQIMLWIVSGMVFSLIYDRALGGEREARNIEPAPLSIADIHVSADQASEILQNRFGHSATTRSLALQSHGLDGRPVYIASIEKNDRPAMIDAHTGKLIEPLSAEEARTIAQRDFTGAASVESVETITRPYQKGYDYFGELPVYRVNFANWKGTRIYVSADTGDIRLRRNIGKSIFDLFWTLHMFGYVDHDINGNPGLIAVGAVSMISLLSGVVLYLPYVKRKLGRR
jgi:uncharacterized iron-regulated membrane protein